MNEVKKREKESIERNKEFEAQMPELQNALEQDGNMTNLIERHEAKEKK